MSGQFLCSKYESLHPTIKKSTIPTQHTLHQSFCFFFFFSFFTMASIADKSAATKKFHHTVYTDENTEGRERSYSVVKISLTVLVLTQAVPLWSSSESWPAQRFLSCQSLNVKNGNESHSL